MLPLPDAELVTVPATREAHALAALNADPDVRYAAPNVRRARRRRRVLPVRSERPLDRSSGLEQVNDADIDVPEAWDDRATGVGRDRRASSTQQVDAEHPDLQAQHRARRPRTSSSRRLHGAARRPAAPTTARTSPGTIAAQRDNDIGIAGHRPARPRRCRCGRSTTAATAQLAVGRSTAFDYAGEQEIPIVVGVVRDRPAARSGRQGGRQHGVRRGPRPTTGARCTSSRPATRATTTTSTPVYPVQHTRRATTRT